jgi:integrase
MARQATGQVVVRERTAGRVYAIRFRAYGERQYVTLGTDADGWDRQRAETELQNVLADVRRGVWRPPVQQAPPIPTTDPTFHEFASAWYAQHERDWEPHTAETYRSLLSNHLLPFFAEHTLRQISVSEVDRYRENRLADAARRAAEREKVIAYNLEHPRERRKLPRRLGTTTINKTLVLLGSILAVAEERGLLDRNPLTVNPQRRKAKRERRRPVYLDSAEHIHALLEAASELDNAPDALTSGRRAMIATLALAGLRVGEACALNWRDVNLPAGWLYVGSKTDAGMRDVRMLPALRDELLAHKATTAAGGPDDPVFVTATGARRRVDNARQRVMEPVIRRAERALAEQHAQPLPDGLTAHKLRHTFASILAALNTPMPEVIAQLGHTDPAFTLRVYAHTMRRDEAEIERLRALVEGRDWAPLGTGSALEAPTVTETDA